jgi:LacI family transcriptional regulator
LTGFEHPEYLSVVFKRETGQTPGQYRRSAQPGVPSSETR